MKNPLLSLLSNLRIPISVALGQAILNNLCSHTADSILDPEKLKECNVLELGY